MIATWIFLVFTTKDNKGFHKGYTKVAMYQEKMPNLKQKKTGARTLTPVTIVFFRLFYFYHIDGGTWCHCDRG